MNYISDYKTLKIIVTVILINIFDGIKIFIDDWLNDMMAFAFKTLLMSSDFLCNRTSQMTEKGIKLLIIIFHLAYS